ncbi:MAG: hypothetical protein JSV43_00480 [Methanobacteriota archaeon]|nr:MAG: hypothetical protein JSV43_00480 [Euryarchaeota archaeon]
MEGVTKDSVSQGKKTEEESVPAPKKSSGLAPKTIILAVILAVLIHPFIRLWFYGDDNLYGNFLEGLFMVLLVLSILVILIPIAVKFWREEVRKTDEETVEKWMTRLRTIITITLTLVLLVFVVTWIKSPEVLEVRQPSTVPSENGTNATGNVTQNVTVGLNPFVNAFFGVYAVVIAFYFTASAIDNTAEKVKEHLGSPERKKKKMEGPGG